MSSVTVRYKNRIALFVFLVLFWGLTGAALLTSEKISSFVVVPVWTVYLAFLVLSFRATLRRKIILEPHRIGWHNGWRRETKWCAKSDVIAAYAIDHAKVGSHGPNPAVNRMARTFKGYGIVVREPDANKDPVLVCDPLHHSVQGHVDTAARTHQR